MKKRLTIGAVLVLLAGAGIIGWDWVIRYCERNPNDAACPSVLPTPTPSPTPTLSPSPTTEPTAVPTPTPTATPTEGPSPTPTPTPSPGSACPKPLAPGAYTYLNAKAYGQGWDATVRVHGDPEFCRLIHGVSIDDCHLEGWARRSACEIELIGGCPIWQYTVDKEVVYQCVDDRNAIASCDHFGSVDFRDDPQTKTTGDTVQTLRGFEGRPLECGLQRNELGPVAGFFAVAHGKAYVGACKPDKQGCSPWRAFDH